MHGSRRGQSTIVTRSSMEKRTPPAGPTTTKGRRLGRGSPFATLGREQPALERQTGRWLESVPAAKPATEHRYSGTLARAERVENLGVHARLQLALAIAHLAARSV